MNTCVKLIGFLFVAIPIVASAQNTERRLSCVKDITYSKEFLSKFPDAGAACIEAKTANGKKWIRFNAEVKKKEGDHLTVEFLDKEEKAVTTMIFAFDPNATIMMEDKSVKAASAAEEGDKIMVWVPETRFDLYAKPGASQSEHFTLVSNGQPQER
jgi:hypothetical protein